MNRLCFWPISSFPSPVVFNSLVGDEAKQDIPFLDRPMLQLISESSANHLSKSSKSGVWIHFGSLFLVTLAKPCLFAFHRRWSVRLDCPRQGWPHRPRFPTSWLGRATWENRAPLPRVATLMHVTLGPSLTIACCSSSSFSAASSSSSTSSFSCYPPPPPPPLTLPLPDVQASPVPKYCK